MKLKIVELVDGKICGMFESWEKAYKARDEMQKISLASGYCLKRARFSVVTS